MPDVANPAIAQDLCAREPIHIPGAIQPHGVLLAVDERDRICREAGDLRSVLGWDGTAIGHPIGTVVDAGDGLDLCIPEGTEGAVFHGTITTRGRSLHAFAHRSGSLILLELEPVLVPAPNGAAVLKQLLYQSQRIADGTSIGAACSAAATAVREATGYDRVMVYRLLDDGSGAVIAEDRHQELARLLNHHYPAADIPRQARALYLRNPIRVIPDVEYVPAPIRGDVDPLDLSGALLRSVSPVHIQYLKNMDVGASASMSIIQDGTLWGLVACHNRTPKQIPHERRELCQHLTLTLQQSIARHEEGRAQREALMLTRRREELLPTLAAADSLREGLTDHVEEVRRLVPADGIAVLFDGQQICAGVTPSADAVETLGRWLAETSRRGGCATEGGRSPTVC